MLGTATALLCTALVSRCNQLLALGDSNTCIGWPCSAHNWPNYVAARLLDAHAAYEVKSYAVPGMTAAPVLDAEGREIVSSLTGEPNHAGYRLEMLLAAEDLRGQCLHRTDPTAGPRLVLAVGTNDVSPGSKAQAVVDGILALKGHAERAAPCVRVYIATIPPRYGPDTEVWRAAINFTNFMLRIRVQADRLIDFSTGFAQVPYYTEDGVHLTDAGHRLQAERVFDVVFPGLARQSFE